jgi:hypothetical protein
MSLLTYQESRPWARAIKAKVVDRKMPPWFADPEHGRFANDRSLAQTDIDTIVTWVDGGAVEGDAKDAPPPIEWPADGWQIKPDIVVRGPEFLTWWGSAGSGRPGLRSRTLLILPIASR